MKTSLTHGPNFKLHDCAFCGKGPGVAEGRSTGENQLLYRFRVAHYDPSSFKLQDRIHPLIAVLQPTLSQNFYNSS